MAKRHNKKIQEASNIQLRSIFNDIEENQLNCILRPEEDQNDKGIDFEIELENFETNQSIILFKIQNKGTDNINILKDKKISFQFKVRNIKYYRNEINLPVIITLCDTISKKTYWHPIQLDNTVDKLIKNAETKKKKSIQIYINQDNELTSSNLNRLFQDVIKSREQQYNRHNVHLNLFENLFEIKVQKNDDIELLIIDQLYNYLEKTFSELNIIPLHFYVNNYPFKETDNFYVYYHDFTLYINNNELFEIFNNINITEDNQFILNNSIEEVDNQNSKLTYIINKLNAHHIYYIKSDNNQCNIQFEFKNVKKCDCIECAWIQQDYSNITRNLNNKPAEIQEIMLFGYIHYQLGDYKNAIKYFTEVKGSLTDDQKILNAICQFNLQKISRTLGFSIIQDQENEYTQILNIDLDKILYNNKNDQNFKLLSWILDAKFISNKRIKIFQLVQKIEELNNLQQNGGWSTASYVNELMYEYAELEDFVFHNRIVYDEFSEYHEITDNFIWGLFLSHSLIENKLDFFDEWIFLKIVKNGKPEKVLACFEKSKLKEINYKIKPKPNDQFLKFVDNYLTKFENVFVEIEGVIGKISTKFIINYQNYFCNILILLSISDLDNDYIKIVSNKIYNFLAYPKNTNYRSHKYLELFINRKAQFIGEDNLLQFLELFEGDEKYHQTGLIETIFYKLKTVAEYKNIDQDKLNKYINQVFETCQICNQKHDIELLTSIYPLLSEELKKYLKGMVEEKLNVDFNPTIYYYTCMSEILEFSDGELKFKFIEHAKSNTNQVSIKSVFSNRDNMQIEPINMLINLSYKYESDLSGNQFNDFRNLNPYYSWLFNLKDFNYEDFEPSWIKEYPTVYYYREFRKHPIIKSKLLEYLKLNNDTLLSKIFLTLSEN